MFLTVLRLIWSFFSSPKMISFIAKYWRELFVAALAGIILYQNLSGTRFLFGAETIPSLEHRLAVANANFKTCQTGNKNLSNAIDKSNTEVQKWKDISDGLKKDIGTLQGEIDGMKKKTDTDVKKTLNDKTPNSCKASMDYLRNATKDLKW